MKNKTQKIVIAVVVAGVAYYFLFAKKEKPSTGAKVLFEGDVDGKGRVLSIPDQILAERNARIKYEQGMAAGNILSPEYNPLA